jgi:hypothetical protein
VRRQLFGVLLLAVVPIVLVTAVEARAARLATRDVTIDARCTGGENTSVTLRPWNLKVRQGDDVRWVLNANANSDDITITPKREAWPFVDKPPYKGGKGRPARTGGMRPNAKGRYAYNVTLICTNGAKADTVQIDPDIIVD